MSLTNAIFGVALICISAVAAGLTLGILSLDLTRLRVIEESGVRKDATENEKRQGKQAGRLIRIRAQGNQLLITLLLVNVATNAAFSILMGESTNSITGFLLSTGLITLVGEIIPQAVCTRYALEICSHFVWLVIFWEIVLYPVVMPVSWFLDWALGKELGGFYSRDQLYRLIMRHNAILRDQEIKLVQGGLTMENKTVMNIAKPMSEVFLVSKSDAVVDILPKIIRSGYSRVPIVNEGKICAILLTKDLLLLEAVNEDVTVGMVVQLLYGGSHVDHVDSQMAIIDLLDYFKEGNHCHMCVVRESTGTDYGIITLEDVVECLIQCDIQDEHDEERQANINLLRSVTGLRREISSPMESCQRRMALNNILLPLFKSHTKDLSILWPFLYERVPCVRGLRFDDIRNGIKHLVLPKGTNYTLSPTNTVIVLRGQVKPAKDDQVIVGSLAAIYGPQVVLALSQVSLGVIDWSDYCPQGLEVPNV